MSRKTTEGERAVGQACPRPRRPHVSSPPDQPVLGSPPRREMAETFPRRFGRYTLIDHLAQGGMGSLYLAYQGEPGMEKLCVVKTVLRELADKEYVARFRDEAKVVVRL